MGDQVVNSGEEIWSFEKAYIDGKLGFYCSEPIRQLGSHSFKGHKEILEWSREWRWWKFRKSSGDDMFRSGVYEWVGAGGEKTVFDGLKLFDMPSDLRTI